VVAALGLPHARFVPTLVASRVGMSLALAISVPTLGGGPLFDTGGGGLLVIIIVVATSVHKRVNLDSI